MDDAEHTKLVEKKEARRLQKETGMKYTEALRAIRTGKYPMRGVTPTYIAVDEMKGTPDE